MQRSRRTAPPVKSLARCSPVAKPDGLWRSVSSARCRHSCQFERTPADRPKQKSPHAGSLGAPGWNRTSDTRFRKPQEGVVSRSAPCAKMLHCPRFLASTMLGRTQPCWAVVRRLVGRPSATALPPGAAPGDRRAPPLCPASVYVERRTQKGFSKTEIIRCLIRCWHARSSMQCVTIHGPIKDLTRSIGASRYNLIWRGAN